MPALCRQGCLRWCGVLGVKAWCRTARLALRFFVLSPAPILFVAVSLPVACLLVLHFFSLLPTGLRKRIYDMFLQFVENPEFNPEAARFQRVAIIAPPPAAPTAAASS